MTFHSDEYKLWCKEYPMFSQWAINKDILFIPKAASEDEEEKQYDLTSKAYVLMKRLGQDYDKIMRMDAAERDTLFEMEMRLVKEEAKQNENNNN